MKKPQCKFQSILLSIIRQKLNLMLSEIAQLKNVTFENHEELTQTILEKIAKKKIKSIHISAEEGAKYLELFNQMNPQKKVEPLYKKEKKNLKNSNPFKDSPFN